MMRSLFAGISGLRNFQTKMDIIGNNIANVNTVGFKGSRITFAESMAQTLAGETAPSTNLGGVNAIQVGLGMRTIGVDSNFAQGSLEATGVMTDLAIQGNGFFVVSDGDQNFYTRAGNFHLDAEGNLVASGDGCRVMGYLGTADGAELERTTPRAIQIPLGRRSQAKATTEIQLYGNLDMNMTQSTANLTDAGTTGITSVSGTVDDGVGGLHEIQITGQNATRSIAAGAAQGLTLSDTLGDHGVTDVAGFTVTVDGGRTVEITGLTTDSTVGELINAINAQVSGVEAELDADGAIQITRTYHGDGQMYNVQLTDGGVGDVVANLFDVGGAFDVDNGAASTLTAVDNFTPTGSADAIQRVLGLEIDERTGLVTGLLNFGGGGVSINAPDGLAQGTAVIETADTTSAASIFVYDSLGNTNNLTVTFTRSETPGVWRWSVELPEPASVIEGGSGTVSFRDDGSLDNFSYDGGATGLVFNPGNGAQDVELAFGAGNIGSFDGMTLSGSPTSIMAIGQDGYGMGILEGISIDNNGCAFGNFSNGVTELLAQVLLANFTNPQALERIGNSLYRQTLNSGDPRIDEAESTGSTITSGYLEMSNVDLSREFTDMILAQRAFQASARVITVSDGLLDELTRLKR